MKSYTITVNGNVYDVTVEETGAAAPVFVLRKAAPAAALQAQARRRLAALFFPPREEKWDLMKFPFGKKLWWLPSFFRLFSAVCRRAQGFFFENT